MSPRTTSGRKATSRSRTRKSLDSFRSRTRKSLDHRTQVGTGGGFSFHAHGATCDCLEDGVFITAILARTHGPTFVGDERPDRRDSSNNRCKNAGNHFSFSQDHGSVTKSTSGVARGPARSGFLTGPELLPLERVFLQRFGTWRPLQSSPASLPTEIFTHFIFSAGKIETGSPFRYVE